MKFGIYIIKNKVNNKVYIGQSVDIDKRIKKHFNLLENKTHYNEHLQNAFNKYGRNNFFVDVLEECPVEKLNEREKYYIQLYDSATREKGYNIEYGGNNSTVSNETKEKLMIQKSSKNIEDIISIKKELYKGTPRKIISQKYNISKGNLDAIAQLNNYRLIAEELNEGILHKKNKYNQKRNNTILRMLKQGFSNKQISDKLQVSISVVEKVKYKYPDLRFKNKNERIDNYNKVQQLKEQGYRPSEIIKILGISSSVVYRYYKEEVNPNKNLSYKKVDSGITNKIIKLSEQYNYSEIGKIVNLSRTTVKNVIDNYKYANTEVSN